jgi:uncharacterized membrane protein (UPF0127 family)
VGCREASAATRPEPARVRVTIASPSGRESAVTAEVARTPADRERGLMFRTKLADHEGMLFVFDEDAEHAFWMRNTLIPLDMIFIDTARSVVGVVERAVPGSLEPRSGGRCRYVLEVRGGWVAERGVRRGDRVVVEELPR